MYRYFLSLCGAALAIASAPASASLVLVGPNEFQGTGLGTVNTVLTLQSAGSSSSESGSVAPNASGSPVPSGDALQGTSQIGTPTFSSLGLTNASDLRIIFNAQEPGNTAANSIILSNLT